MGEGVRALKIYLPLAVLFFLVATTGVDIFARIKIAGEPFAQALKESLYWSGVQFVMTIMLLVPFVLIALICAYGQKRAPGLRIAVIFAIAMVPLLYFYVDGHFAAQQAMKAEHWTAAALSVGLLPFFIGAPVVLLTFGVTAAVAGFDRDAQD